MQGEEVATCRQSPALRCGFFGRGRTHVARPKIARRSRRALTGNLATSERHVPARVAEHLAPSRSSPRATPAARTSAPAPPAGPAVPWGPRCRTSRSCPAIAPPLGCNGVQNGPGATAFTRMPFPHQLLGHRLRERHDARLGLGVVDERGRRVERLDRRRVDDRRPGRQVRHGRLGDPEQRVHVRLERRVQLLGRQLGDRRHQVLLARVVDQDVQPRPTASPRRRPAAGRTIHRECRPAAPPPSARRRGSVRPPPGRRSPPPAGSRSPRPPPPRANAMAAARPMPESPPVISARRPSNRPEPL